MTSIVLEEFSFETYFDGANWYAVAIDNEGEEMAGTWGISPEDAISEVVQYLRDEGVLA